MSIFCFSISYVLGLSRHWIGQWVATYSMSCLRRYQCRLVTFFLWRTSGHTSLSMSTACLEIDIACFSDYCWLRYIFAIIKNILRHSALRMLGQTSTSEWNEVCILFATPDNPNCHNSVLLYVLLISSGILTLSLCNKNMHISHLQRSVPVYWIFWHSSWVLHLMRTKIVLCSGRL